MRSFLEERGEYFVLMAERLLERHRGDLAKESQVRILFHHGQGGIGLGVAGALAFLLPAGVPGGQRPVPHHADAAERTGQHLLLCLVGVCSTPVCRPHPHSIEQIAVKLREARRVCRPMVLLSGLRDSRFLPRLKARASSGGFGERACLP